MHECNIYKYTYVMVIMGATEALRFIDVLYKHRLLSRRTIAQYVVDTLLMGKESREGSPGYNEMEERIYAEVFDEMLGRRAHAVDDPSEEAVSPESYFHLRQIIETAVDGRHRLSITDPPWNGFSERAYGEVGNLLGRVGRRYLGLREYRDRMSMDRAMIRAIVIEDGEDAPDDRFDQIRGPESILQDMARIADDMKQAESRMNYEMIDFNDELRLPGIAQGLEDKRPGYRNFN